MAKRLSVDISKETHQLLNKHLKKLRLKNAVFEAIADHLVSVMDRMTEAQKRRFLAAILEKRLRIADYTGIKETTKETKTA